MARATMQGKILTMHKAIQELDRTLFEKAVERNDLFKCNGEIFVSDLPLAFCSGSGRSGVGWLADLRAWHAPAGKARSAEECESQFGVLPIYQTHAARQQSESFYHYTSQNPIHTTNPAFIPPD